jgi:hypothetical protein
MSYILNGRLQAHCTSDFVEPLAHETVRLYWIPEGEESAFAIRSFEEARSREYLLMAQGRTDGEGRFRIEIDGDTILSHRRSARRYSGEPLSLEVYYRGDGATGEPVQFVTGHVQPRWEPAGVGNSAEVEQVITAAQFSAIRTQMDAWTIRGTVTMRDGLPAAGYRVSAFDADPLHDDFLGAAVTDARGIFRIDYAGSSFRPTPIAGIDLERGGPEIYFSVEDPDGAEVYREPSSRGQQSDRARSPNWFVATITVEPQEDRAVPLPPTAL